MAKVCLHLHDQSVELRYPALLDDEVGRLFGPLAGKRRKFHHTLTVREDAPDRYSLEASSKRQSSDLSRAELLMALLEETVRALVEELDTAVALHAGAVACGKKSVLVAGASGAGKSSVVAWLTANGFQYLSDELSILRPREGKITGFARPLLLKAGSRELIAALPGLAAQRKITAGTNTILCPNRSAIGSNEPRRCALIVFPRFVAGAELAIRPLTAAQAGLRLMECNLNARNLKDHGFGALAALAREVGAVELQYGDCGELGGTLDVLARFAAEGNHRAADLRKFLSAFGRTDGGTPNRCADAPPQSVQAAAPQPEIPEATPERYKKKLTIGMATYDDYDGVYFTVQGLRLYHPEIIDDIELVVIDNHPEGPAAKPLKSLDRLAGNYRYVPSTERSGTAVRDLIFREASSPFVMCIDCHVLIVKGAVKRLMDYLDANPDTIDLLQGPLLYDDLKKLSTHLEPQWRAGMYGTWATDSAAEDADAPPFEIPMQGLGLFACRRAAWPGFNPAFRGFGGEEGYIHEKFRRAGGRTLCLPFLRWVHRFNRPLGTPYRNIWEDRIRNYMIGFSEVGLDVPAIEAHFRTVLGEDLMDRILPPIRAELEAMSKRPAPRAKATRRALSSAHPEPG